MENQSTIPLPAWAAWLPAVLGSALLLALGAHIFLLGGLQDPAERFWIDTIKEASSYYLWKDGTYRRALWGSLCVVGLGLTLGLVGHWIKRLRRPARVRT